MNIHPKKIGKYGGTVMKKRTVAVLLILVLIISLIPSSTFASGLSDQVEASEYVEGEVLVRFKTTDENSAKTMSIMNRVNTKVGAETVEEFESLEGLQLVQLDKGVSVEEALLSYNRDPNVLYAEPNYRVYAVDEIEEPEPYNKEDLYLNGDSLKSAVEVNEPIDGGSNDTTEAAITISAILSDTEIYNLNGAINVSSDDKDYYEFTVTTSGGINIHGNWEEDSTHNNLSESALAIDLIDSNGNKYSTKVYDSGVEAYRSLVKYIDPGTYYIAIYQTSTYGSYIGAKYKVGLRFDIPRFSNLWGLHNTGQSILGNEGTSGADISADEAWEIETGTSSAIVAVVDTGVDYTHPDLMGNMWTTGASCHGRNFVDGAPNPDNPMDDNGHGTHVAGTIAASSSNGTSISGVMWNADIMALKVLDAGGSGDLGGVIEAIEYANANGAQVINMSLGGGDYSEAFEEVLSMSTAIIIAAAGNEWRNNDLVPFYPASYDLPNLLSVAATDNKDTLAYFSNYGSTTVDVAAPGEDIYSTMLGGGYQYLSGTSMAAPHVAGLAGLILSAEPNLSNIDVVNIIKDSVDEIPVLEGKVLTKGRINAKTALEMVFTLDGVVIEKGTQKIVMSIPFYTNARAAARFVFNDDGDLIVPSYILSSDGKYYATSDFTNIISVSGVTMPGALRLLNQSSSSSGITVSAVEYRDGEFIITP